MRIFLLIIFLILTNCTIANVVPLVIEESNNKNNIELIEKLIEEPYQVNGKWFYPYDYKKFEEIGLAQLETSLKNGSKTKNGEYYHNDTLTGAHRSLPLPSIIEVTNLNNGKSALVRVNHREAFSSIKVVNLSEAVFKKLDMNQNGDLVKISLIDSNESFVLSEAYTYDEEKKIVEAPVSSVVVVEKDKNESSANDTNIKDKSLYNKIFINIASFAFKESAQKIKRDLSSYDVRIFESQNLSGNTEYRVLIGPYSDVESLLIDLNDDTFKKYEDLSIYLI
jgi:rare lipoprotein A